MEQNQALMTNAERENAIRRRVHRLAEFYRHAVIFIVVNGLLFGINAWSVFDSSQPNRWYHWWAIWPSFFWGIGLACHGLSVLPVFTIFSDEWEDRKVRELMERKK